MVVKETYRSLVKEKVEGDGNYNALLNFFDSRYENDTERTNYAHVINSMKEQHKVIKIVETYNKVLKKLLIFVYGDEKYISGFWVEYGFTRDNQRVWEDLKAFLNDQIKRVFEENQYTDQLAFECITNLREGSNEVSIIKFIASKSSEEVNALLTQIAECKKTVSEAPKHMSKYNKDTNKYREYKPKYINDIKFLIKNGYHKGYDDVFFEMQTNISYMPDKKSWVYLIISIIVIPLIAILVAYLIGYVYMYVIVILALISMVWKGK